MQTPYPGPSAPVLSADGTLRVEASNYDAGGEGVSWHDATAGIVGSGASDGGRTGSDVEQADGAIVWISDGEWLEYTIDVAEAGRYELDVSTASTQNGQGLDFEVFRAGEARPMLRATGSRRRTRARGRATRRARRRSISRPAPRWCG